jgi:type I restriction enzyme S subunit
MPQYFVALPNDVGFRTVLKRFAVGSTQIHIRNPIYQKIEIPIPPIGLQNAFELFAISLKRQQTTHRTHLAELDTLFASLQSRAFRGEL